jgi:hypothetical protein
MSNNREMPKEVYGALIHVCNGINYDLAFHLDHLTNKENAGPAGFDPQQWFRAFMLLDRWSKEPRADLTPQDISDSNMDADKQFYAYTVK